ncbi:MAG: metallophosphoesterase family protein [Acidimicrobiia bacterium]|nr:metallophosphoesterase family protein [Acidimicrobiia bacterium]
MRHLILTDIHANLEALDAVLADARARTYDDVVVLGDVVGYGADPNAVVERVRELTPVALVRGNHDKVACGLESAEGFNHVARTAAKWTYDTLTPGNRQWVADLPPGPLAINADVQICHGSPIDEDEYIFGPSEARVALLATTRSLCLFGHTHYPAIFESVDGSLQGARVAAAVESELRLRSGVKYLVNPGSVGQPRDGDPRAAYAIVDAPMGRVELVRVTYPVQTAQEKIRKAGLPDPLADRLALGR